MQLLNCLKNTHIHYLGWLLKIVWIFRPQLLVTLISTNDTVDVVSSSSIFGSYIAMIDKVFAIYSKSPFLSSMPNKICSRPWNVKSPKCKYNLISNSVVSHPLNCDTIEKFMVTLHYLKVTPTINIKLLRAKPDAHPAHKARLFSKPSLLTDYLAVERQPSNQSSSNQPTLWDPQKLSHWGLYRIVSLTW